MKINFSLSIILSIILLYGVECARILSEEEKNLPDLKFKSSHAKKISTVEAPKKIDDRPIPKSGGGSINRSQKRKEKESLVGKGGSIHKSSRGEVKDVSKGKNQSDVKTLVKNNEKYRPIRVEKTNKSFEPLVQPLPSSQEKVSLNKNILNIIQSGNQSKSIAKTLSGWHDRNRARIRRKFRPLTPHRPVDLNDYDRNNDLDDRSHKRNSNGDDDYDDDDDEDEDNDDDYEDYDDNNIDDDDEDDEDNEVSDGADEDYNVDDDDENDDDDDDRSNRKRIDRSNRKRIDRSNRKRIDRSNRKKIDRSNRKKIDYSNRKKVYKSIQKNNDYSDRKKVDYSSRKKVYKSIRKNNDYSDRKKVDYSNRKDIDRSGKKNIDRSNKNNIDFKNYGNPHRNIRKAYTPVGKKDTDRSNKNKNKKDYGKDYDRKRRNTGRRNRRNNGRRNRSNYKFAYKQNNVGRSGRWTDFSNRHLMSKFNERIGNRLSRNYGYSSELGLRRFINGPVGFGFGMGSLHNKFLFGNRLLG